MGQYNPKEIEPKWQKYWSAHPELVEADNASNKPKFYCLDMFPYPSGAGLHIGHVESYTATDIASRYQRMQGKNVLHPQGWDAFGLPAENYAIKTKVHPTETTKTAIETFKGQMNSLGFSYDWSREINSSDPQYYKWTQWMFLLLYKNGLAYKKKAKVNWCESCQTVLANEQVVNGECERCGGKVIQKDLEQWFFKITDFIEDKEIEGKKVDGLISGLKNIDWPESTKAAQVNWIGRSEGAEFEMAVTKSDLKIRVYTTRLDTVYGMTYAVIAPEHPIVKELQNKVSNWDEVEKYLAATKKKSDLERIEAKEKSGVELKGVKAINPFNNQEVPLFVADYVLSHYGTGAVMAVPAHDERDFEFAKKYNLPIKQVVVSCGDDPINPPKPGLKEVKRDTVIVHLKDLSTGKYAVLDWHRTLEGVTTAIMGGIEEGQTPEEAALMEIREEAALLGGVRITHSLRWITGARYCASHKGENRTAHAYGFLAEVDNLSSQGVIAEEEAVKHTLVWVDESEVLSRLTPVHQKQVWKLLHKEEALIEDGYLINSGEFDGMTSDRAREKMAAWLEEKGIGQKKINYRIRDWLISRQRYWGAPIPIIYCDHCGTVPVPEKDLPVELPTDVDFRPTGQSPLVDSKIFHAVKCPLCGASARRESDTMDTFVCSSWYYLRYADPKNSQEFASKENVDKWLPVDLYVGGAEHSVLHLLYARFFTKVLQYLGYVNFNEPFSKMRHQGIILGEDGNKMSKSKGNVVNPDDYVKEFGADILRMYEMFMGPLEEMKPWNSQGIVGVQRFLEKVWRVQEKTKAGVTDSAVNLINKTIKKVGEDIESFRFNTAISAMMILVNELDKSKEVSRENYEAFLKILSPFAPHLTEEIWSKLGNEKSIFLESWPAYDEKLIQDEEVEMVVQINGKVRDRIRVAANIGEEEAKKLALASEKIQGHLAGKEIKKVVFVQGKLISIVI